MKKPLEINVFWDVNSEMDLHRYADIIYGFFLRDPDDPLDRYLGIPVNLFPNMLDINEVPIDKVKHSVNILLIGHKMTGSGEWREFVDALIRKTSELDAQDHVILPIGLVDTAFNLSERLSDINFVRMGDVLEPQRKESFFLIRLLHPILQLLYRIPLNSNPAGPLKLFLSHTKKDEEGKEMAINLKRHIDEYYGMDPFFDANDIMTGSRFVEVIEHNIANSLLVVLHTDTYSSREWCRKELITAKKLNRPVIVVNQFYKGEQRSFPYIGNVPHLHYGKEEESELGEKILFDIIILEALREALKIKFLELIIHFITQDLISKGLLVNESIINQLRNLEKKILFFPPELFTLIQLKELTNTFILYPDPPLGKEELELLSDLREDLTFITPTMLPLISSQGKIIDSLQGLKIGISLSESDLSTLSWIENRGLENVMGELSRYLLISGTSLIYSGNMKYQNNDKKFNFSELLVNLIKLYRSNYESGGFKLKSLINYSFYPISKLLTDEDKAGLVHLVSFNEVPIPESLGIDPKSLEQANSIVKCDTFDKRYVWAKSLTRMREMMMEEGNSDAWIIMGGKWVNFKGKMSGILEEYLLAKANNKPIFLLGGFGGVSLGIIQCLRQEECAQISQGFYEKEFSEYASFLRKFNGHQLTLEEEKVDYRDIEKTIKAHGASTESYGLNNGLSREENEILFETKDEWEIISLILKGLKSLRNYA